MPVVVIEPVAIKSPFPDMSTFPLEVKSPLIYTVPPIVNEPAPEMLFVKFPLIIKVPPL
jgi:hypothetical protein